MGHCQIKVTPIMIDLETFDRRLLSKINKMLLEYADIETAYKDVDFRNVVEGFCENVSDTFCEQLCSAPIQILNESKEDRDTFERQNYLRWREGFDLLSILLGSCVEIGESTVALLRKNMNEHGEAKVDSLVTLHARCMRVGHEVFALMRCGFPDGAYARWRTLHELSVTMKFLADQPNLVSERYRDAWVLRSWKANQEIEKYKEATGISGLPEEEVKFQTRHRELILEKYSDDLSTDWAWARPGLQTPKSGNENWHVSFTDIQKATNLDHWRPWIKLAHQEIHGGYVRPDKGFGVSEAKRLVHLAGASNSGMTDPGQNLAIALSEATVALMQPNPSVDTIIYSKSLRKISDKVFSALQIGERRKEW